MYFSASSPKCFGSRNSQWKNRNIRNVPPPANSIGADFSIISPIAGLLLNAAVQTSVISRLGLLIQKMMNGSNPLMTNTAISMPHIRNQRLAHWDIFDRTSALIIALSMLVIISKRLSPRTMSIIVRMSMKKKIRC